MFYVYLCLSAAAVPILDKFFPILRYSYSWWLVPVLFIASFVAFILLHAIIFVGSLMLVKPGKTPKCVGYYKLLAKLTLPLISKILRMKITLSGEELIPENARFIIIANHTSILDPVILMAALPECEFAFIAKKETTKMPVVPQFITSQGGVFVDRENLRSGAKALIDVINLLKKDKASVGIFPEGTRSKTGEILPFKPGAIKAAAKANVPLTVCTIKGAANVFKNFPLRSSPIAIDILKTYSEKEVSAADGEELQNEARAIMIENLK